MYFSFAPLVCLFFFSLRLVSALPHPDLVLRQLPSVTVPTALASPTSVTTTNTIQTTNGTVIETCVTTLTPVGQQIQEVQNCTLAMGTQTATMIAATSTVTPAAAAKFVLPGTTLLVLPVGLVVYGGISAIAIAAVAFVTWERVQYRKAFRRQRMAEANFGGVTKG